jgi:nucleoside-diphosphate-sugar epimerase
MTKILVVGSDGAIGGSLLAAMARLGFDAVGTSRRLDSGALPLDLAAKLDIYTLPVADTVFLCAGINDFVACDADPADLRRMLILCQ